jgi:hypothetical protein
MKEKSNSHVWLFVLLIILLIILAGLGYYFFTKKDVEQETPPPLPPPSPPAVTEPQETSPQMEPKKPEGPIERRAMPDEEEPSKPALPPSQDECERVEKEILEFFGYLDNQNYVKKLDLGMSTLSAYNKILSRLSSKTPIPAGEGIDSKILIKNLYHFFRILEMKDIYLIKGILTNEKETAEFQLRLFYSWFTFADDCPDTEVTRPSLAVLYKYAGFLINTTGGRAYLSRRSAKLRILLTYYSSLIVYQRDLVGKNSFGINVQPLIAPLKDEIARYTDLQYQRDYLNKLREMEDYYGKKRG